MQTPRTPLSRPLIALVFFVTLLFQPAHADPQAFKASSLADIQAAHAGKPFILLLWSLECPSCLQELDGLAAALEKYPDVDLVMVSTDEDSYGKDTDATLAKHGLQAVQSWIFADANPQALRHAIDPSWYGELPRTYFYDAKHQRQAHSGVLTLEQIEAWRKAGGKS